VLSSTDAAKSVEHHSGIDIAVDNLCTGATTCRDEDGVVWPEQLAGLTSDQREMLSGSGRYGKDEVFPRPLVQHILELNAVDHGYINHLRVRGITGGHWRDLVASGLPVERALTGLVYDIIRDGLQKLPPHLFHALERRPQAVMAAADAIGAALAHAMPMPGGQRQVPAPTA
jgi:hypothetical protein